MKRRPTIADLANTAGVSIATVNRILSGSTTVRSATIQRVQDAASEIGYYGVSVIDARRK
jgi:LacI family transcriptional regulator